jgi:ribonuclease P/MRP protein subunit POP1
VVGSRVFNTHLHKCDSYPFDLLGPATVIWRPLNTQTKAPQRPGTLQRGNETSTACLETQSANVNSSRCLWLRFHPVIFECVARELKKAITRVLDRPRPSTGEFEVEIADLRGQINSFEIMGPTSNQVLTGALSPVSKDDRNIFKQVCCF